MLHFTDIYSFFSSFLFLPIAITALILIQNKIKSKNNGAYYYLKFFIFVVVINIIATAIFPKGR